jgi:4-hydroxybenzoate polyprenyltransferase
VSAPSARSAATPTAPASLLRRAWALLRVPQWLHFIVLPVAGLDPSDGINAEITIRMVLAVLASSAALGWAFGLNAITDRRSDASSRKNPLAGSDRVPDYAWPVLIIAFATALAAGAALGTYALLLVAASLFCGTAYSDGPRVKRLPGLGLITNLGIFVPLLFLCADGASASRMPGLALCFGVLLAQNQLLHEWADMPEDQVAGDMTTARWLGAGFVRPTVVGTGVIASGVSWWMVDELSTALAFTSALAIPTLAAVLVPSPAAARMVHRYASIVGGAIAYAGTWWVASALSALTPRVGSQAWFVVSSPESRVRSAAEQD